jgi:hypothetical protein
MFRATLRPSSGATTAVAASGVPSELGDSSAVGRGRAGRPKYVDAQKLNFCSSWNCNLCLFSNYCLPNIFEF